MTTLDDIEREERIREVQSDIREMLDTNGITAEIRRDGDWVLTGNLFDIYEALSQSRSEVEELA